MRKIIRGILMTVVVAAFSAVVFPFAALANSVNPSNYTVDFANQKITVADTGNNSKIYVAKATVTVKKVKGSNVEVTTVKTSAPTEYDLVRSSTTGKGTIDISSYSVAKDIYLSIWGNLQIEPILIKLPATNMKMKAVFNAANTSVTLNDITDKSHPFPVTPVEYCTTNGRWTDYETDKTDLTSYTAVGATLRFRIKAQGNLTLSSNAREIGTAADGSSIRVYTTDTGNFASNEFKVKIAKTAKGPKATFDYTNHLIKVPNTCEYRVQYTGSPLGAFTKVTGNAKTVTLNADDLVTKGSEFDIRTVATDKKPATKITEYYLNPIPVVAPQTSKGEGFSSVSQDVTDSRISNPYGPGTGGVQNLADFKVTKLTFASKTPVGTMTVKNGTTDTYQFIVADPQQVTSISKLVLPKITDRVTGTVSAGKTASIKVKSGQFVYIRKASDTKAQQWSSPYQFYGVVLNTLE